jgi:hypothetical protein
LRLGGDGGYGGRQGGFVPGLQTARPGHERLPLGWGDGEHLGYTLGHLLRGSAHSPFDLLNRGHGAAYPVGEPFLGKVQRLSLRLEPPPKRSDFPHRPIPVREGNRAW